MHALTSVEAMAEPQCVNRSGATTSRHLLCRDSGGAWRLIHAVLTTSGARPAETTFLESNPRCQPVRTKRAWNQLQPSDDQMINCATFPQEVFTHGTVYFPRSGTAASVGREQPPTRDGDTGLSSLHRLWHHFVPAQAEFSSREALPHSPRCIIESSQKVNRRTFARTGETTDRAISSEGSADTATRAARGSATYFQ